MPRLRFTAMLLGASAAVLWRRLRGRSRSARWTLPQEVLVETLWRNGRYLMAVSPVRARAHLAALPGPTAATRRVGWAPVDVDGLEGTWVRPPGAPDGAVLLYFPGGGYVLGGLGTYRDLLARLALAAGTVILAVAYRQAPEHPFPAAIDDCERAFRWLQTRGTRGARVTRIAVGGDSAGGALAVATMLRARNAGEALPAGAVLFSPWVDLTASGASVATNARLDWGDRAYLLHWAGLYLSGADARDPQASPVHADLRGLPPMLVQVGDAELLLDEVSTFVHRARTAGVRVELKVWEAGIHGAAMLADVFPDGQRAIETAAGFLREILAPAP